MNSLFKYVMLMVIKHYLLIQKLKNKATDSMKNKEPPESTKLEVLNGQKVVP